MKCFATSIAVTAASMMALGCPFPEQCIGDCEPSGDESTTTTDPGTATSGTASGSHDSTADSSSTAMSDDESGSSTGGAVGPCDGSPLALCLPATEEEDALCLCPVEPIDGYRWADAVDLDGDGVEDLLTWDYGGEQLLPYLTTAGGLVPLDPEPSPLPLRTSSFYEQDDGAMRFLLRVDDATQIGRYMLGEGLSFEPLPTTQISEGSETSSQTVADFDGDGALDLAETWGVSRGEQTVGVLFDVLGSPSPPSWSAPVDVPSLFVGVVPCTLDDDGAYDGLIKGAYGNAVPMWGLPMQPTMMLGGAIPFPEGAATCRDLDGDGDGDIFVRHGCYDCSPRFGGYTVFEQSSPGEFIEASSAPYFDEDLLGGRTVLARLTDPASLDLVSLGFNSVILGPFESNFGLRRATAPMQWDDGRHTVIEGLDVTLVIAIDSDHDGLDELVLQIRPDGGGEQTYLYRAEPAP